ncbi:hypothetical protein [Alkalicoccobacillus porphyridii]|uniref:Uncharacterized protein n=1 Tax=Alkalicoccobacillus porphyridii TaxID=2597270 RepID=A0A554A0C4_9BACI|nr:hypothetical protein [Alkalicoccobacillus porphyridii]TSB47138.1 hypothetical protein FN960_09000 [Alkalicoccobacillus porphyridii]
MDNEILFIKTFSDFYDYFWLPVLSACIGGLLGHFHKNQLSFKMPTLVVDEYIRNEPLVYTGFGKNRASNWLIKSWRTMHGLIDYLLYLLGVRQGNNKEKESIKVNLGYLGDLLVAIGAGILAKAGMSVAGDPGSMPVIVTSFLAGFAGLSYIIKKEVGNHDESMAKSEKPEPVVIDNDLNDLIEQYENDHKQSAATKEA